MKNIIVGKKVKKISVYDEIIDARIEIKMSKAELEIPSKKKVKPRAI